jgi:hypothetical protein
MSMIKIEANVWNLRLVTRSVQFSIERDETQLPQERAAYCDQFYESLGSPN